MTSSTLAVPEPSAATPAARLLPSLGDDFSRRHIGPSEQEVAEMVEAVGVKSLGDLVGKTVPQSIRLPRPLNLPPAASEAEALTELRAIAEQNKVFKSYLGTGYHDTVTAAGDSAEHSRKSRLVHAVHAVPGRDRPGGGLRRC